MKKTTYINSIRSCKKIQQAVLSLAKEVNDIKDLTITSVVQKAKINRGTFYNHYSSVDEVIDDIEKELLEPFYQKISFDYSDDFSTQSYLFFNTLTQFLKDSEKKFSKLAFSFSHSIFDDLMNKVFAPYHDAAVKTATLSSQSFNKEKILQGSQIISTCLSAIYKKKFSGEMDISLDRTLIITHMFIQEFYKNTILD